MDATQLLQRQPRDGRALYIDMNSFFASVEQQLKPELRGRPVGVCPFINDATCVIAASIEAKRFGIRTGTSVREARRLCPEITLISDHTSAYRDYHRRIMGALDTTRCQVTIKSIDEAYLALPHDLQANPMAVAHDIKELVQEVGSELGCSIGIASNMFLAKMGTKLHKPYGMVMINLEDLEAFYATLKLTDLYGISWRMARRLGALGIDSPLDFFHAPYTSLKAAFGVNGERWYMRLRGYEVDQQPTTRRMIGHQATIVPNPATTRSEVLSVASQLCYKAAVRLRAAELAAQSVQVMVRHTDRSIWSHTIRTHSPFWDSHTFYDHVVAALEHWAPDKPARLVSVSAIDLLPQTALTQSLFSPQAQSERLSQALDLIETKYGRHTISPAVQLLTHRMRDAVGFGNAGQAARELSSD